MMEAEAIAKKREHNWAASEKDCLRDLVIGHIAVIENRQNNLQMIKLKKDAWKAIRMDMVAAGFDRDVPKLKQQWMRMKVNARKAVAQVRRATVATGNLVDIPTLDEGDMQVQSMIACDFEEDTILIDSNTLAMPTSSSCILDPEFEVQDENEAPCSSAVHTGSSPKKLVTELRNLPRKKASKIDVIKQRQNQIAKESGYDDELHLLRVQQLQAEVSHQARMNKREDELMDLKCQLVRLQIINEEAKRNN